MALGLANGIELESFVEGLEAKGAFAYLEICLAQKPVGTGRGRVGGNRLFKKLDRRGEILLKGADHTDIDQRRGVIRPCSKRFFECGFRIGKRVAPKI